MITDKQIEEAQESIFEEEFLGNGENVIYKDDEGNEDYTEERYDDEQIKEAIKLGAHWAIEQILKGLWHPASKEPKFGRGRLLVLINGSVSILNVGFVLDQLRNLHNIYGIKGWLYLDDLLPKEGGEQ